MIPDELTSRRQWINWAMEGDRKIPKTIHGCNARTNDPSDFVSYGEASSTSDHIAYVIQADDGLAGIDLDNCLDDRGELRAWAAPVISRLQGIAYGEISPSGRGIKFLTKAKKPEGSRCTKKFGDDKQQLECYDFNRFWTITKDVYAGNRNIGDGQAAIDWICSEYLSGDNQTTSSTPDWFSPDVSGDFGSTSSSGVLKRAESYVARCQPPSKGDRNNSIFRLAGHLFAMEEDGQRLYKDQVVDLVFGFNASLDDPLLEPEVVQAINSAEINGTARATKPGQPKEGPSSSRSTELPKPLSVWQLIEDYPTKREPIVDGLFRRGETVNIIGAPKAGKSWFIYGLMLSVASGRDWLGMETAQGKVLLVDNEIHHEELASRFSVVARSMAIPEDIIRNHVEVIALRGRLQPIDRIGMMLNDLKDNAYSLVVLDSFYRVLPDGTSENDNAQMASVFNTIDHIAGELNTALVLNHHSTKGDQSQKGVTDVGAGAGSIARAADCHLIVRPHELEACAVLEGVCRSFPPIEPVTIGWEWPLWSTKDGIEPQLKTRQTPGKADQEKKDREADDKVVSVLETRGRLNHYELRKSCGMGQGRVERAVARLDEAGRILIRKMKNKRTGKRSEVVEIVPQPD